MANRIQFPTWKFRKIIIMKNIYYKSLKWIQKIFNSQTEFKIDIKLKIN